VISVKSLSRSSPFVSTSNMCLTYITFIFLAHPENACDNIEPVQERIETIVDEPLQVNAIREVANKKNAMISKL